MELIVAILVFVIVMAAVTSIFAPMLRGFQRANNLAEANTLLDNLATLMMADINNARYIYPHNGDTQQPDPEDPTIQQFLTITTTFDVIYSIELDEDDDNDPEHGIVMLRIPITGESDFPLLEEQYYRGATVSFSWDWDNTTGLVELTFELTHPDGWIHQRTYTARPVGLV
jgi:type II secretory pathway pseudopilin PulG